MARADTGKGRGRWPAVAVASVLVLGGCQQVVYSSEGSDDSDWEGPQTPWWEDEEGGGDAEPTPDDGDEAEEGPGGDKLDMPEELPLPDCKAVDLLFVVDNSNSMMAEQDSLATSFEGFIAGIQANLTETNDYHIGVVTTDAYAHNVEGCQSIGALVTQTDQGECGPWAEGRFISLADDLDAAFTCAAKVGIDGSGDEHQLEAALTAIGPEQAGPGGCNEGFLRDDALLVLVLITDEDDGAVQTQVHTGSPGHPADWIDAMIATKGLETNVVVLSLAGVLPPNACKPGVPYEDAQLSKRIEEFTDAFTYGRMGDVCADDYTPFFDASLNVIVEACAGFTEVE